MEGLPSRHGQREDGLASSSSVEAETASVQVVHGAAFLAENRQLRWP